MMKQLKSNRIESLDILRGIVMILMALDHTRDYFHLGLPNPTNLETTTPILFATRFITHYCAPIFVFLAGSSACLYGSKRTKKDLFKFLFTRGLWLIFLEIFLNNFLWWFDITFGFIQLQVIWAIGCSMVVLSFLIYLPKKAILLIAISLIAGHNLLDGIVMNGDNFTSILWRAMHQSGGFPIGESRFVRFSYPLIPWIGIISLGYCFGAIYKKGFDILVRKKLLLYLGIGSILLFLIIRGINIYGDLVPWVEQKNSIYTIMSFLNVTKYPPSLDYALITLGPALLFLYAIEGVSNKRTKFAITFGRVPLFFYFLHILIIHLASMLAIIATGGSYTDSILNTELFESGRLDALGFSLGVVYIVWVGIILIHYPLCNWYMKYKLKNRDKWWLSYL
ncbi:MAG: heparan-alpha-glucosaminide N-acetyltransferase domain-containing protein [Psychroserpens sp.]|uniref:DUF1624 domain-containing protein n=1 Tax=Psychroserpens sp. TaxID=2020870 RepID=UPI003001207C